MDSAAGLLGDWLGMVGHVAALGAIVEIAIVYLAVRMISGR